MGGVEACACIRSLKDETIFNEFFKELVLIEKPIQDIYEVIKAKKQKVSSEINDKKWFFIIESILTNPRNKEISIKGWYIFGGKTKSDSSIGISNDLYILKLGIKPCEWIKCNNTMGNKPCPRYFHSMNYFENGNFIIIHGGRNDNKSESFALNDTFILNLENFNWIEVQLFSQSQDFKIFPRCSHCSIIYNNKLIICGGMNNNNYLGSALLIVNLDGTINPFMKSSEDFILNFKNK